MVVLRIPLLRLVVEREAVAVVSEDDGLRVVLGVHADGALGDSKYANALSEDGILVRSDRASTFGDELVSRCGFVDFAEFVFGRSEFAYGLRRSPDGEEVARNEREVGGEFADFGVDEDEG